MVALDEQHLRDGLAHLVQRRGVVADLLTGYGGYSTGRYAPAVDIDSKFCLRPAIGGAGRHAPVADLDGAQLAAAMRRDPGAMAQMRDIDTGCKCRIHNGLPILERDYLPVYCDAIWRDGIGSDRIFIFFRTHIIPMISDELPHHRDA